MEMNNFIIFLTFILGISFFSCNCHTKEYVPPSAENAVPKVTFQYFDISGNDVFVDTINLYLKINQIDEVVKFEYYGKYEETFCVNFLAHKGYKIFGNDTTDLLYVEKYKIVMHPQNDTLDIYRFIGNPWSIDGAHYLFFSPQLGIVLKKSTTWTTFSELSEHFLLEKNILANQLTSILLYKEYLEVSLKVPMEEPPPPPLR